MQKDEDHDDDADQCILLHATETSRCDLLSIVAGAHHEIIEVLQLLAAELLLVFCPCVCAGAKRPCCRQLCRKRPASGAEAGSP